MMDRGSSRVKRAKLWRRLYCSFCCLSSLATWCSRWIPSQPFLRSQRLNARVRFSVRYNSERANKRPVRSERIGNKGLDCGEQLHRHHRIVRITGIDWRETMTRRQLLQGIAAMPISFAGVVSATAQGNRDVAYGGGTTLPAGIRSRLINNVNGITYHVLEAGFEGPARPLVLLIH